MKISAAKKKTWFFSLKSRRAAGFAVDLLAVMSKDGYSTKEVAKLLHFSEEQVREFARQGVVEGGRHGEPVTGQGKGKKFRTITSSHK